MEKDLEIMNKIWEIIKIKGIKILITEEKGKLKKDLDDVVDVIEYFRENYYLLIDISIKKIEYKKKLR
jgi:hypothetical protein